MIITKAWLQSCRTSRGAWTKAQAEILGLEYPLAKGWQQKVQGRKITAHDKRMFELAADKTSYSAFNKVLGTIRRMSKENRQALKEWVNANI